MSYNLASAGLIAVLGGADSLTSIVEWVQNLLGGTTTECSSLPMLYLEVAQKAFTILAIITGIGMGIAIISLIGPAIANVFSVVATFPGLALTFTLITSMTLLVFLTVFGSLAVVLAPAGLALMAVPAGKLKGIGAWLIATGLVFVVAGPYIPEIGIVTCSASRYRVDEQGTI